MLVMLYFTFIWASFASAFALMSASFVLFFFLYICESGEVQSDDG